MRDIHTESKTVLSRVRPDISKVQRYIGGEALHDEHGGDESPPGGSGDT